MFKHHALQLKMVKTADSVKDAPVEIKFTVSDETANNVVQSHKEMVKHLVIGAAVCIGISAIAQIAAEGITALIDHAFDSED